MEIIDDIVIINNRIVYSKCVGAATAAPAVTYDYGYGRTTYDTTKTYYQQQGNATYAAAAQSYETAPQPAAKVGYQTAQYVAGPTRNNVQAKTTVAAASYNTNQAYAPQTSYPPNTQANANPKRKYLYIIKFHFLQFDNSHYIDMLRIFYSTSTSQLLTV